jgi:uncharacterized protein
MAKWRILTIDGGGIRGIIAAAWLKLLEDELKDRNQTLVGSFDLVCGTSTGSIVAAAVATGMDMGSVVSLFKNSGPKIFQKSKIPFHSFFRPKYNGKMLGVTLNDNFGNDQLEDSKTNLCITAYDIVNRKTLLLRSYEKSTKDLNISDCCHASCSAPVYFPAHKMQIQGAERTLIDGGVSANNPSSLSVAESILINKKKSLKLISDDIVLISLGTGSSTRNLAKNGKPLKGIVDWAEPIIDVLFDGSSSISDHIVSQILDQAQYLRIQYDLNGGQGNDDLDDASEHNINLLLGAATAYVHNGAGNTYLDKAINLLSPSFGQEPQVARARDNLPSPQ